jgi:hypothetical protein
MEEVIGSNPICSTKINERLIMFKRRTQNPELLTRETQLSDEVEDALTSLSTRKFERKYGLKYGENSALVPSAVTYDLPLLTDEEFRRLTDGIDPERIKETYEFSKNKVENFSETDQQQAAELAQKLSEALRSLE